MITDIMKPTKSPPPPQFYFFIQPNAPTEQCNQHADNDLYNTDSSWPLSPPDIGHLHEEDFRSFWFWVVIRLRQLISHSFILHGHVEQSVAVQESETHSSVLKNKPLKHTDVLTSEQFPDAHNSPEKQTGTVLSIKSLVCVSVLFKWFWSCLPL